MLGYGRGDSHKECFMKGLKNPLYVRMEQGVSIVLIQSETE